MPRIVGTNIPPNKKIYIALTYIYGIGVYTSFAILARAKVIPSTKARDISEEKMKTIREKIDSYAVEGNLRTNISMDIKTLVDLKSYRGLRHSNNLPVRGQRTRTNARTRKIIRKFFVKPNKKRVNTK